MRVGAFSVVVDENSRTVSARTNSNVPSDGTATCFEVFDRRGRVVVGDIFWATGERDVRVLEVLRARPRIITPL